MREDVRVARNVMRMLLALLMACVSLAVSASVTVKTVTAQQRYPWNGLVDIVVTMEGSADEVAQAECSFVATNGATLAAVPVTSISRNGSDSGSGTTWTRRFIWNATNDVGTVKIDVLELTVDATVIDCVQLWENGPYWSKYNVGASKPEGYGYYFSWGDTVGYVREGGTWSDGSYSGVTWVSNTGTRMSSSPFASSSSSHPAYAKDNATLQAEGYIDSSGNLVAAHDAAAVHLGAPWRMPTEAEFSALNSNCTATWTTRNSVPGQLFTGKGAYASKSIFLPAAGVGQDSSLYGAGWGGYYLTSTPNPDDSSCAWYWYCCSSWIRRYNGDRCEGRSVRPLRGFDTDMDADTHVGKTVHLKLDCRTGARAWSGDAEILRYDASWFKNCSKVQITDNGTIIATGSAGVYNWHPELDSTSSHVLKLEALSGGQVTSSETVTFNLFAIKSVTAHQRYPWNGLVDIAITIQSSADDAATAKWSFAATNSATKAVVPVISITKKGEVTGSGTIWTSYFVWDSTADVGEGKIADVTLTVGAKTLGGIQLWENGPLWAESNIGSSKPQGSGYYFWFGDTVGYVRNSANDGWISAKDGTTFSFSSENCPTYGKQESQLRSAGYTDATGNLVSTHDAATVYLGAPWRLPTVPEFEALLVNCTATWTTRGGVYGRLVTGKGAYASKSIFLPAVGYGKDSELRLADSRGFCWSSHPLSGNYYGCYLIYDSSYFGHGNVNCRYYGYPVRPIREFAEAVTSGIAEDSATIDMKLDLRNGERKCSSQGENILFDVNWYEDADQVRITDNGVVLTNGMTGVYTWIPETCSPTQHLFRLEVLSAGQVVRVDTVGFSCPSPTSEHTTVIANPAIEPTSSTPGRTAEIRCSRCGEILQAATEIPALGYIRNVTVRQVWPYNCIEVNCTLADDIADQLQGGEQLALRCVIGGMTNTAMSVIGDISTQPGVHRIVWNVGQDGLEMDVKETTFIVSCEVPRYLEVDLNNISSISWPVRHIFGPSASNWSDDYKTNKLVLRRIEGDKPYYIGVFEVTQRQYELVVGPEKYYCKPSYYKNSEYYASRPVESVAFYSAISFISRLSGGAGRTFDLPTETQWIYACRAGTTTDFNNGHNLEYPSPMNILGRYEGNCGSDTSEQSNLESGTAKVGSYLPNAWGLYDMHGNVGEWCYGENGDGSKKSPSEGDRFAPVMGGSFDSTAAFCTSSKEGLGLYSGAYKTVGFRVICSIPETEPISAVDNDALRSSISINEFNFVDTVDGAVVRGTCAIAYTPVDCDEVVVEIDGEGVVSSVDSGMFVWQPLAKGVHTIKHIAGTNVWTRTLNVTSLVYDEPTPNPPTAVDTNLTLSTTVRALTSSAKASGTIGTSKVNSSYSGTWSATTSADWLTLTYTTRNVGLPVIYTTAENLGVEARTGYIYVSGHVFTVTQPGVGGSLDSEAAEFDATGGEGTFTVTVGAQASWRAMSNVDWISVETVCGTGETEVVYHVAPWNNVSTRSGTITAAGCTFTVNQTGRPMKLNETKVAKDYLAHDIVLTVDALASTDWGIALDAPWVSIVDRGSGNGGGTVTLAINENPSYVSRTATALIGTETLMIVQTGRPTAALAFAISPEATTASVKGANGVIAVEATPDLPWTATSQANWLTIMPGFSSAAGNGNVVYAATPNPTMAERSGTIRVTPDSSTGIAGKTHSVTQPAATSMISVEAHTFAVDGDSFAVDVTVDDVVAWAIVENVDWLSVDGAPSRNGPGSVKIAVDPNMSIEPREATLTIAGHEFHVVQRGRAITLEYGETIFAPESYEEATIEVHPNGEVAWTATPSDATWISVWSEDANVTYNADGSVSGIGDATLKYMVTAYVGDGGVKTGWIQIGNEKVYVAQRAYDLSIDPTGVAVSGNAGSGSVAVPATVGQVWNAIATEPWIKLVGSYDEVTGSGIVSYTFTDNDTGAVRTGKIVIAGEEYTITQAARQMVTITTTVSGEGGMVSGGGRYTLGASVTLNAVVNDDDHRFVRWERGGNTLSTATSLAVTADVDQEIIAVFEKIKTYVVNDEEVKEGTTKSFTAPEPVVLGGTTQLVCRGTSAYPNKGTSFQMQITGNVSFEWDLWQTNYWVAINQTAGGTVSGPAGWITAGTEVTFAATPSGGKSLYRWVGIDNIVSNDPSITSLVSRPLVVSAIFGTFADTLATAADAPSLIFITGGDANWTPVIDATAQTGCTSLRSGAIGQESESWLETTVSGSGILSFRWRTDCERDDGGNATWDRLAVFVNGVEMVRLDGKTDWRTVELPLTDAKSVVRWSFYRDDHDETGAAFGNCGWIDGVANTPTGVQLWEDGPYWAECNVGASKPEEYGYYFWWGDTVGYKCEGGSLHNADGESWYADVTWVSSSGTCMTNSPFDYSTCPTYGKDNAALQSDGYVDMTGNLVSAHDAATVHLGAPWRMPTAAEIDALVNCCDTIWTMRNGVYGRLVTGRDAYASKSIFIPAVRIGYDFILSLGGSDGGYWSSSVSDVGKYWAWELFFSNLQDVCAGYGCRYWGQAVRPVRGFVK